MKSFKEYLLEGQEEIDAAIRAVDAAYDRENKIWYARRRLETMLEKKKGESASWQRWRKLNRMAQQKVKKRINPTLKKTFDALSPEDRMGFLLSPHNSLDPGDVEFHDKHTPGGAAGQTMYDKLSRYRYHEMFPLKDLRDAEDILSVVRSSPTRRYHSKDRNFTRVPLMQDVEVSDAGDPIVMGGTFHERKKLRIKEKNRKSS